MSLASRFKTDSKAANEGIWVEFEANDDGSIPKFKISRMSSQNKVYQKSARKHSKGLNSNGAVRNISDEQFDEMTLDIFVDSILLGWENVQPKDDGKEYLYTKENAKALLSDPNWVDLYDELANIANSKESFKKKEEEAKN